MSDSVDWLLELGHSRLKLAPRLGERQIGRVEAMPVERFGEWLSALSDGRDQRFWLASVPPATISQRVNSELARTGARVRLVETGSVALPVAPAYSALGVDRWLAMQPVWASLCTAFCLVDAGTATTIDVVDQRGRHRGGWILPGMAASRAGLLASAPGLAGRSNPSPPDPGPARDTGAAVDNGLLLQQVGAIERALVEVRRTISGPDPVVVVTGGAAGSLQSALEQARLAPDLVLIGLAMAVERWWSG